MIETAKTVEAANLLETANAKRTEFKIKLAGKVISVSALFESTKEYCKEYLVVDEKTDYSVMLIPSDITYEQKKSKAEDLKEGIPVRNFSENYLETLALYRKIAELIIDDNIMLFHGSVLSIDGKGYIFTAKSGTGKSTHSQLWREVFGERVVMINDDKPLLKITSEGVIAYGTPWDGKHRLSTNTSVLVNGICILNRDSVNHIEKTDKKQAYAMMVQQSYHSKRADKMMKILTMIDQIFNHVNIYELGCNMEKEAAIVSYNSMKNNK